MAQVKKSRSGHVFFALVLLVVFSAIIVTALLANDFRNLNRILDQFGYPEIHPRVTVPLVEAPKKVRVVKGVRLPAPRIVIPVHAFTAATGIPQGFVRAIRADPRELCERLRESGFADIAWVTSAANIADWECSSILSIGAAPPDGPQSSVFVSVKGDGESRITSFRTKLNIETVADTAGVVEAGSKAALVFLRQVQWENDGNIVERIKALEPFDLRDFGSHILFKREFGDPPRYNFLANQIAKPRRTIGDTYFDRSAWLALSDAGLGLWMPESGLGRDLAPGAWARRN